MAKTKHGNCQTTFGKRLYECEKGVVSSIIKRIAGSWELRSKTLSVYRLKRDKQFFVFMIMGMFEKSVCFQKCSTTVPFVIWTINCQILGPIKKIQTIKFELLTAKKTYVYDRSFSDKKHETKLDMFSSIGIKTIILNYDNSMTLI